MAKLTCGDRSSQSILASGGTSWRKLLITNIGQSALDQQVGDVHRTAHRDPGVMTHGASKVIEPILGVVDLYPRPATVTAFSGAKVGIGRVAFLSNPSSVHNPILRSRYFA